MSDKPESLFRAEAFERYRENRQRAVLPRFARPHMLRWLLATAILLAIGVGLFWFEQVPSYVAGTALPKGTGPGSSWLVVVPATPNGQLRAGQPVLISPDGGGVESRAVVAGVAARSLTPREVAARWALSPRLAAALPPRSDVGVLSGRGGRRPASAGDEGDHARVEVGRVRLISLLFSHQPGRAR